MSQLQRITTQFIDAEDRIRLAGEDGDGEALVLWLTRRLLNRLLPHLFSWLEQRLPASVRNATHAEMIQSVAQQAAQEALEPQAPVCGNEYSRSWLVQSVDIACTDQGVTLAFKPAAQAPNAQATLTLPDQALRQWLNILREQYQRAEWPLDRWPEWMAQPAQPHLHAGTLH